MAKQKLQRGKSSGLTAAARKPMSKTAGQGETIAEMRRERDDLANRLANAEARIAELESRRQEVIDRIDWVLDTLATLAESQTADKRAGRANSRN